MKRQMTVDEIKEQIKGLSLTQLFSLLIGLSKHYAVSNDIVLRENVAYSFRKIVNVSR